MNYTEISMTYGFYWSCLGLGLLLIAWYHAAKGSKMVHRLLMILMIVGSWVFVVSYLLRYVIPGEMPQLPEPLMVAWLAFHGSLALIPLVGGTLMAWARMHKGNAPLAAKFNQNHQRYGRIFIPIWLFTHLGGIANYYILS